MQSTRDLEDALVQVQNAAATVEDEMFASQLGLCVQMLASAVAAAKESLNAGRVNDIEFAANDLAAVVNELSTADADRILPALHALQSGVARLKEQTSLPAEVVTATRALQAKLRVRREAIERRTYRPEGSSPEPLPHAPEALRDEALALRQRLAGAGFNTPALDTLIKDPASFRLHSISELLDELDVIAPDS